MPMNNAEPDSPKRPKSHLMRIAALVCLSLVLWAAPAHAGGRFESAGEGKLKDTQTGLVWMQSDYGYDLDWLEADFYCLISEMRVPTLDELAALYDASASNTTEPGEGCAGGYHIDNAFSMTCANQWASDYQDDDAGFFSFGDGKRYFKDFQNFSGFRVLCVSN